MLRVLSVFPIRVAHPTSQISHSRYKPTIILRPNRFYLASAFQDSGLSESATLHQTHCAGPMCQAEFSSFKQRGRVDWWETGSRRQGFHPNDVAVLTSKPNTVLPTAIQSTCRHISEDFSGSWRGFHCIHCTRRRRIQTLSDGKGPDLTTAVDFWSFRLKNENPKGPSQWFGQLGDRVPAGQRHSEVVGRHYAEARQPFPLWVWATWGQKNCQATQADAVGHQRMFLKSNSSWAP